MKKTIGILLCVFLAIFCNAQNYKPAAVKKKAVEQFNRAMELAESGKTEDAIAIINKSIAIDPNYLDAYIFLASVFSNQKKYSQAIETYDKAFLIDPAYSIEYRLPYAICHAGNGNFEKALEEANALLTSDRVYTTTKKSVAEWKLRFQFAINYAAKNKLQGYRFSPKNLGDSVNTQHSEYLPCFTIDNRELIFTRNLNRHNEDFFYSIKNNAGWQAAMPVEGLVNTTLNEGAQMISSDGQWLVFTGCNREQGFGSCDIYLSVSENGIWSNAVNVGNSINTEFWESQPCLSPDTKRLFFSSRRPGGYGGSDIYVAYRQANGRWGRPENVGPAINTAGDEQGAFIHADNQTLFFTSNGLPGYGDADLFYAKQQSDGKWNAAINLGYPINTIDQEGTIFIASDGATAYYSSDRADSRGGLDIYSFELREDIRPVKTLWIKGRVYDAKTNAGITSVVELVDINTGQPVSQINTADNGAYLITLPIGKDYAFSVNKNGYLFYSDNFLLKQHKGDSAYEKNIPLQSIAVNASVVLQNIFFDINKVELKIVSQTELNKLVALLKQNPSIKVEIGGHTDNEGSPIANQTLSINRANAVVKYLTEKGIAANRLSAIGHGEARPIATNETEQGRATNRRTEMKIIQR